MDPATLSAIGTLAAGGAQVYGAFQGTGGISDWTKRAWWRQYKDSEDRYYNALQHRVADAKKAGLHPLFALGNAGVSSSMPGIPMDSKEGVDWGTFGHGTRNITKAFQQAALDRERSKTRLNDAEAQKALEEARRAVAEANSFRNSAASVEAPRQYAGAPVYETPPIPSPQTWPRSGPMGPSDDFDTAIWNTFRRLYRDWIHYPEERSKFRKMYGDKKRKAAARGFAPEGSRPGWKPSHMR